MAVIEVRNARKKYGANTVLNGITLAVDEHAVVCLIGASGSGKSTLLRCINGLEVIDDGEVLFDGQSISAPGVDLDQIRQHIGIVFQSFNLFPHLTILENVMFGPRHVLRMPKAQAAELAMSYLERVGLPEKAICYPDVLSGGQQQRVAIARALAMQPRVMLLDEITSALDPELVGEVLTLVKELSDSGMTLLLATHEMGFAKEAATKVCFLHQGEIYEEGPPEQVLGDPQRERTGQFLKRILEAGRL